MANQISTTRITDLLDELRNLHDSGGNLRVTIESMLAANPEVTADEIRDAWSEATEDAHVERERESVSRVRAYWDGRDANNAGWYVETRDARNEVRDDSQKVWFPVDVEEFGRDQADELTEALRDAFPGATVEVAS